MLAACSKLQADCSMLHASCSSHQDASCRKAGDFWSITTVSARMLILVKEVRSKVPRIEQPDFDLNNGVGAWSLLQAASCKQHASSSLHQFCRGHG
jgi:hypothetical protein